MKERQRILVVDDEPDICDILLFNLHAEGYDAEVAGSAEEAMGKDLAGFDLLLLDVMMPGMSGFQLAQHLKTASETSQLPIIFITAKSEENDMLKGFNLGADDYVTKPFSVKEVLARVKAVLSRTQQPVPSSVVSFEGLQVNADSKRVWVDGEEISLTRTEFGLLWLLVTHQGHVFSRQQLLDKVWPSDVVVSGRTVDVNIARMRKKIGRYSAFIVARSGFGYCFE